MDREKVKELIDLEKLYYTSHDYSLVKMLCDMEKELFGDDSDWVSDILCGITCRDKNTDYEIYFKVLEVLGYE